MIYPEKINPAQCAGTGGATKCNQLEGAISKADFKSFDAKSLAHAVLVNRYNVPTCRAALVASLSGLGGAHG